MSATARLRAIAVSGLFIVVGVSAGHAQESDAVEHGNAKFQYMCAPCHGAGIGDDGRMLLPGTNALLVKYQGALPALLEERADLTADVLKAYLRQGSWSMPPFRPTEITDAEIAEIAAYLAESSR